MTVSRALRDEKAFSIQRKLKQDTSGRNNINTDTKIEKHMLCYFREGEKNKNTHFKSPSENQVQAPHCAR